MDPEITSNAVPPQSSWGLPWYDFIYFLRIGLKNIDPSHSMISLEIQIQLLV